MNDDDKNAIIGISSGICVGMLMFLTMRYIAYVGSPQDIYFTTLNKVMDCRRAQSVVKTASPEILDQICGKIPNISDYVKETK